MFLSFYLSSPPYEVENDDENDDYDDTTLSYSVISFQTFHFMASYMVNGKKIPTMFTLRLPDKNISFPNITIRTFTFYSFFFTMMKNDQRRVNC